MFVRIQYHDGEGNTFNTSGILGAVTFEDVAFYETEKILPVAQCIGEARHIAWDVIETVQLQRDFDTIARPIRMEGEKPAEPTEPSTDVTAEPKPGEGD
jgi:hypothetical protein